MEHRNISLFRGYSDTESVETSLEEIVNIIKCDLKLFGETSDFFVFASFGHNASRRDGAEVLLRIVA